MRPGPSRSKRRKIVFTLRTRFAFVSIRKCLVETLTTWNIQASQARVCSNKTTLGEKRARDCTIQTFYSGARLGVNRKSSILISFERTANELVWCLIISGKIKANHSTLNLSSLAPFQLKKYEVGAGMGNGNTKGTNKTKEIYTCGFQRRKHLSLPKRLLISIVGAVAHWREFK